MSGHRRHIQAYTAGNVPPFKPATMYRATCSCGWRGVWWHYRSNAEADTHECADPRVRTA